MVDMDDTEQDNNPRIIFSKHNDEIGKKSYHNFHDIEFTFQYLIYTIWKFLWICIREFCFH